MWAKSLWLNPNPQILLLLLLFLGMTCTGFPGPGRMTELLANPMQEFIEPDGQERVHEMFEHFLLKFPKKYANMVDRKEHNQRRDIFRQNLRSATKLVFSKAFSYNTVKF